MRKLILAILALALAPLAGWAETPKDTWESLKQLQPGHKIKVVDKNFKAWSGKLVSVSDEAIAIREKSQQRDLTLERAHVLRVTDLERSQRGRNAIVGAIAGALVTAVVTKDGSGDPAEHALFGAMLIGIGTGVGAAIPYPRPTIYRSTEKRGVVSAQRYGSE